MEISEIVEKFKQSDEILKDNISDIIVAKKQLFGYCFLNAMTGKTSKDIEDIVRFGHNYILIDEINQPDKCLTGLYISYDNDMECLLIILAELKKQRKQYFWKETKRAFIHKEKLVFCGDTLDFVSDVDIRGQAKIDKTHPQFRLGPWFSYDILNNKPDGSRRAYIDYLGASYQKLFRGFTPLNIDTLEVTPLLKPLHFACGNKCLTGTYNCNLDKEDTASLPVSKEAYNAMITFAKEEESFVKHIRSKTYRWIDSEYPLGYMQRIGNELMVRYFFKEYDNTSEDSDIRLIEYKRLILNEQSPECFDMDHESTFWNIICYIEGDLTGTVLEEMEPFISKYFQTMTDFPSMPRDMETWTVYQYLERYMMQAVGFNARHLMYVILCFLKFPLLMKVYRRYFKDKISMKGYADIQHMGQEEKFRYIFFRNLSQAWYQRLKDINASVVVNSETNFQYFVKKLITELMSKKHYEEYEKYLKSYPETE